MASTDPIELEPANAVVAEPRRRAALPHDDAKRVRLYFRLAAATSSLTIFVVVLLAAWLLARSLDASWGGKGAWTVVFIAILLAATRFALSELRLRSYRVSLTADAVIFEYGRKRSYVPRHHILLFGTESSILLRMFGLRRCNLHTGGGVVVVSPVPADVATAIERWIFERSTATQTGQPDAVS